MARPLTALVDPYRTSPTSHAPTLSRVEPDSWSTQREVHIDDFILQPWSADAFEATDMAFLPDGRALLTTKGGWNGPGNGEVVLLAGDGTTVGTVLTLPVCGDAERGLLGIEVDPDFDENQRFYVYYTKGTSDCAIYLYSAGTLVTSADA